MLILRIIYGLQGRLMATSLLSLLPPSCMVVLIGELANKHFFTSKISSTNTIPTQTFILPTVSFSNNTGMNIFAEPFPDNYDKVRSRSLSTNKHTSRNSSMSSTKSSVAYHKKMKCNNTMVIDKEMVDISPALSYEIDQKKALCVSKMAEQQDNTRSKHDNLNASIFNPQCVLNKDQHPIPTCGPTTYFKNNNIINIQLPYNPQVPTELEL